MKKIISFIATSAILLNSFYAPLTAIAQEMTPTPEPTPEATSTPDPSPEITPSPTEDPTPAPSETPADLATPSAEPTFIPEEISTPVPTDQAIQTQAPESIPTTPGPPTETSTPETSDTPTPMFTPVIADENAEVTTQVVTKELFPETVQENSVVKLITDKLDYTPSEIAIITGTGFTPDKTYSLTISSSDDPATTTTVDVTASGDGEFTYEYQLDGKYRPNYSVEVKDGEEMIASTSFTDSAVQTYNDAFCMQDNPASASGLTCTANDVSVANARIINIEGDGCSYPGDYVTFTAEWDIQSNSTERYDVGLYFATDGQSNALTGGKCSVSTLATTPSPYKDLDGDQCGDITSSEQVHPVITMTAVCNPDPTTGLLKIPYCTSWDNNKSGICSNPSEAVPSEKSKCNCKDGFTVNIPVPPSIEVVKSLSPVSDLGKFNLQVNGLTAGTGANVGNGGTTGKIEIVAGSIDFGESAGTGTSLDNYTSNASCVLRGTTNQVSISPTGTGTWNIPNVTNGQDIVCTITNTVNNGTLTVIKHVDNNYGGTKVASDFTINVTGGTPSSFSGSESGTSVTVPANGIYSVSETPVAGYSASYSTDCSGTMPPGGNKTCTITNTDIQPKLTITKVVINDNGGAKVIADFPLFVGSTQVASGIQNSFNAGTYIVSETQQTGYTMTGITGNCASNGSITLAPGDVKSCTITNNDNIPALHLRKTITNDNGGTALATAWTLSATGTAVSPTNLSGTTPVDSGTLFKTDTYTLAEIGGPSGYSAGTWDCGGAQMPDPTHVVVPLGANVTCTINNNDIPPSLTLNKILSKTHGGNETEASWTLTADGGTAGILSGPGAAGSIDVVSDTTFKAGTYTLSELGSTGYSPSSWSCTGSGSQIGNQITLSIGQSAVCSITNSDVAPTITLIKSVQNLFGGTAGINDFGLTIGGTSVTSGQVLSVNSNTSYSLNEAGLSGYEFVSLTGTLCPISLGGTITLNEGGSIVCTITNRDIQPKLTVIKHVISDNGGTKTAGDFTINVTGTNVSLPSFSGSESGTEITLNAGEYSVDEIEIGGYAKTLGANCSGTIAVGETKTCTITNDDQIGNLTVHKVTIPSEPATYFDIDASGTGTVYGHASQGIGGTGTITFDVDAGTYGVTERPKEGWQETDNTCSEVIISSGETKECTITNTKFGSISGTKWQDMDADGVRDAEDSSVGGLTIKLDKDANGSVDATTTTDSNGNYTFTGLLPGTYKVLEDIHYPWNVSYPNAGINYYSGINLNAGENLTGYDFGNYINARIEGIKWIDTNGNGIKDVSEGAPTDQWQIKLWKDDGNGNPVDAGSSAYTQVGGVYGFGVKPGIYYVSEVMQAGWTQTYPGGNELLGPIVVTSGSTSSNNNFGNFKLASISGHKYDDVNANGTKESEDLPLENWVFELQKYNDETWEVVNSSTTNAAGEWSFTGIGPGIYRVHEVSQPGWIPTTYTDGYYGTGGILETSGSNIGNVNFLNSQLGSILVCKYVDNNDNGEIDGADTTLSHISMVLEQQNDGWHYVDTQETGVKGCALFEDLIPSNYRVTEDYSDPDLTNYYPTSGTRENQVLSFTLTSGSQESGNFLNTHYRKISGTKYEDVNGNGTRDAGENGLQDWTIFLDYNNDGVFDPNDNEPSTTTDSNGYYEFNVVADTYFVREVNQTGWQQIQPEGGYYKVDVHIAVSSANNDFGNMREIPEVSIEKTNNSGSGVRAGSVVTYILTVRNDGNITLSDIDVTDHLPGGFSYVADSTTGDIAVNPYNTSPSGALTWNYPGILGAGNSITFSYQVKTDSDLSDGTYTNYATCRVYFGETEDSNSELFSVRATILHEPINCNTDSSTVTLGSSLSYGGTLGGQVLGASTELPATGNPTWLLLAALGLTGTGIYLNIRSKKQNRYAKN